MKSVQKSSTGKQAGWTLLSAVLLLFAAFYNGFPLVTSDTGTYINSGFQHFVPHDRPVLYGLFIRHSSLNASFWFTVLAQAIIMAYLLWQVLNRFASNSLGAAGKFVLLVIITAFSSLSWITGQLMPDVFTPAGIIAFLLLLQPGGKKSNIIFNALILLLSCLVHNSHLLIFSLLALVLLLYLLFSKRFRTLIARWGRGLLVVALVAASWLLAPLINYSVDGRFRMSGAPYAFLMAKNVENGVIDAYLEKNCPQFIKRILPDTGTYFIAEKNSKRVMNNDWSMSDGVLFTPYLAQANQRFHILRESGNYYRIISAQSGKCLQLSDDSCAADKLVQRDFTGADNQLFLFRNSPADSSDLMIVSKAGNHIFNPFKDTLAADKLPLFRVVSFPHCLCMYKGELPNSAIAYLWNQPSMLYRTGSWEFSGPEYEGTLNSIFFSGDYFKMNAGQALLATGMQLCRNDIGDGIGAYDEKSEPYKAIQRTLFYELKPFSNSKENKWQLNYTDINKRNFWLLLLSVCALLLFFGTALRATVTPGFALFIKGCIAALLINAFISGALANAIDRLQARVSWLLPLLALILLFNIAAPHIRKKLAAFAEKPADFKD